VPLRNCSLTHSSLPYFLSSVPSVFFLVFSSFSFLSCGMSTACWQLCSDCTMLTVLFSVQCTVQWSQLPRPMTVISPFTTHKSVTEKETSEIHGPTLMADAHSQDYWSTFYTADTDGWQCWPVCCGTHCCMETWYMSHFRVNFGMEMYIVGSLLCAKCPSDWWMDVGLLWLLHSVDCGVCVLTGFLFEVSTSFIVFTVCQE